MKNRNRALLLIGSPKRKSTSLSIGNYLSESLKSFGVSSTLLSLVKEIRSESGRERLMKECDAADILVLLSPLYVDSLPAPVIRAMEYICRQRKLTGGSNNELLFCSILNCGFPESRHNSVALQICRIFARDSNMRWAGGLSIGEGGVIDGEPLTEKRFPCRNLTRALGISSEALSRGRSVPEEASRLAERLFLPKWLYLWLGELGWRRQAKKNGVLKRLDDRPYEYSD